MALKIGFASKFYTLWDVTTTTEYTSNGGSYEKTQCTYHQNLSINEDAAIDKAMSLGCKDLKVDDELKGKSSSFSYVTKTVYDDSVFEYGKYQGDSIKECTDLRYLIWFFNERGSESFKDNVRGKQILERVIELDNSYDEYDGKILNIDTINEQKASVAMFETLRKIAKEGGQVEVTFTSNIGADFPSIRTREYGELTCAGVETKLLDYQGFEYRIPKVNGKGKRIKNKTFNVRLDINNEFEDDGVNIAEILF